MTDQRTYRSSVELAMRRAFAVLVAMVCLVWTMSLLSAADRTAPPLLVVGVVTTALLAVECVRGWQGRLGRPDVYAASAVAVGLFVATSLSPHVALVVGLRCQPVVIAAVLAGGLLARRGRWPWCAALCLGQVGSSWPVDGPVGAIEGVWPVLAAAAAAAMLVDVMRVAGANADRSERAVLRARAREAEAAGRRAAHRAYQRVLHDDVASALRGVASGGPTEPAVRAACAAAVAAADRAPVAPDPGATTDLRGGLVDLLARHAPNRSAGAALGADPLDVPAAVAEATLRAAAEVVRNVERHANATALTVRLAGDGAGFTLHVTDDGVGFDHQPAMTSVGLRRSVFDGMAEVGGYARVDSAPGRGTTVTLGWHGTAEPVVSTTVRERIELAVGDVRGPLRAVCLPYLVGMGLVAAAHVDDVPASGWLLVGYLLVGAATLAVIRVANRPDGGGVVRLVTAGSLAGVVGSLWLLPPDSIDDYGSWPIGAVTPLFVVLVTIRPVWEVVLALAAEEIAVLVALGQGEFVARSVTDVLPALFAPAFGVGTGYAITRTLARFGTVVLTANRARAAIVEAEAVREARAALHRRRSAEIGAAILPFLSRIAAGADLPDDADPRRHARLLEAMARDELHVPGVLDAATRDRLWRARDSGCTVTIQSDTDEIAPPPAVRVVLAEVLTGVPPRSVTLSLHPRGDEVEVSLVAEPGDPDRAARLRRTLAAGRTSVTDTPEVTWARTLARAVPGELSPESGT